MKTVIYKINSNVIVLITDKEISFSDLKDDEDFCPLSFFEKTKDGIKALQVYYNQEHELYLEQLEKEAVEEYENFCN